MQVGCGYSGSGETFGGVQRINDGVGRIYVGSPYQRGHGGIGSFLAGIFRRVLPLLTRGAKATGKKAVRAGMNIMSDVTTQNTPFEESFRRDKKHHATDYLFSCEWALALIQTTEVKRRKQL